MLQTDAVPNLLFLTEDALKYMLLSKVGPFHVTYKISLQINFPSEAASKNMTLTDTVPIFMLLSQDPSIFH